MMIAAAHMIGWIHVDVAEQLAAELDWDTAVAIQDHMTDRAI